MPSPDVPHCRRAGPLAGLVLALLALTAGTARADQTAVVVGGEPSKTATVVGAIAPWLESRGATVSLDTLAPTQAAALVACFLADDEPCAKAIVAAADVDRLVFVMVDVQHADAAENITLTSWLFDRAGTVTAAERRFCDACKLGPLATSAAELVAALAGEAATAVTITSSPAGATVTIDGKPAGTTPLTLTLAPGDHELVFALAGHRSKTATLAVGAEPAELTVDLVASGGPGDEPPSRLLPWTLVIAGAAAVATGGVLFAIDEDEDSIPDNQAQYWQTALPGAVTIGVGAAALIGGILWLRSSKPSDSGLHATVSANHLSLGWASTF